MDLPELSCPFLEEFPVAFTLILMPAQPPGGLEALATTTTLIHWQRLNRVGGGAPWGRRWGREKRDAIIADGLGKRGEGECYIGRVERGDSLQHRRAYWFWCASGITRCNAL